MFLARVTGNVTCTVRTRKLEAQKLLLIRRLEIGPEGKLSGPEIVALDVAQSGVGDTVLVMKEGGSARIALKDKECEVAQVIVGVVDEVDGSHWAKV